MRTNLRFAVTAAAATALIGGALAVTSVTATAAPAGLYAPSALVLTVTHPGGTTDTAARAVTLSCMPGAGGTHPDPAGACADLRAAGGQFDSLLSAAPGQACTRLWSPVTVTVDGVWQGTRTSWKHTFANSCEMNNAVEQSSLLNF
ncbi:subtilase-type protease inhibitor [Streptomyces sp. PanSC9]|uniref:subtilase-type protease inhibitor n=1 Tax=Streptomyces sp. PanSC9 TaxID=1520461 RepID=UPI000F46A2F0|nr:subtilase-type protease inhibitor [Streptomyces sp. PanSC9]ROP56016.1 subtilisin inhibitor-like [Streptomyces sp. PanSC9]